MIPPKSLLAAGALLAALAAGCSSTVLPATPTPGPLGVVMRTTPTVLVTPTPGSEYVVDQVELGRTPKGTWMLTGANLQPDGKLRVYVKFTSRASGPIDPVLVTPSAELAAAQQ